MTATDAEHRLPRFANHKEHRREIFRFVSVPRMALATQNYVGRFEGSDQLGRNVFKGFAYHAQVRLNSLERGANLAWAGTDAFDRVVHQENHFSGGVSGQPASALA